MDESSAIQTYIPYVLGALTGISWKVLDDMFDKFHIPETHFSVEMAKVSVTLFTTLFLLQDIRISLLFCAMVLAYTINGGIDTSFWTAGIIIPFATTTLLLLKDSFINLQDNIVQTAIVLSVGMILMIADDYFFPEESSTKKTIFRSFFALFMLVGVYILQDYPAYKWVQYMFVMSFFYFFTSVSLPFFLNESTAISIQNKNT